MTVQFIVALLFIIPYDLMQISSIYCSLSNIIYNVMLMYYDAPPEQARAMTISSLAGMFLL